MVGWAESMLQYWRESEIGLVVYVPDEVLGPLIDQAHDDSAFTALVATREEEAIGIAAGAVMGGMPTVVLMQSSGFGNIVNALASLVVPYQLPIVMVMSERGVLGEFNPVQVPIGRTLRPALDALGIPHMTLTRGEDVADITRRTFRQAVRTQAPAALILSPLLTGGKDD